MTPTEFLPSPPSVTEPLSRSFTQSPIPDDPVPLNPLFHPDTLANLAATVLATLQSEAVVPLDRPQGTSPTPPPSPVLEAPATLGTPTFPPVTLTNRGTPSFYFLETLPPVATDLAPLIQGDTSPDSTPIAPTILPVGVPPISTPPTTFAVDDIRRDFPILQTQVQGHPLIWLDNAATTQKPQCVLDRLLYFYQHENSNVHRGAHELATRATDAYEQARETVRRFLNAASANEIIFVRGTTEGINLVAQSWGRQTLQAGDEIVLTHLEHHANIVPWQQLATQTGAKLQVAPVDDHGQIRLDAYQQLLNERTKLVAFSHVSNALGTITPAQEMIALAHRVGAKVLLDGAQSVSHLPIDVQQLGCDWFVFSGHKVFGPTGIGAVYGREDLLNQTIPWQGGGNMIADVTFERTLYQAAPTRFEAGTGNIADAVGLAAALEYVQKIGLATIACYEQELLDYATAALQTVPGLHLIGTASHKASVLSFVLDGFTVETVGQVLNQAGIAVRAGHHCAQPILRRFGLEATVRPSLAFYNTQAEIDTLVATLAHIRQRELG